MTDKIGKDLSSASSGFLFIFRGKNLYVGEGMFLSGLLYDKMIQYIFLWICIKIVHV